MHKKLAIPPPNEDTTINLIATTAYHKVKSILSDVLAQRRLDRDCIDNWGQQDCQD